MSAMRNGIDIAFTAAFVLLLACQGAFAASTEEFRKDFEFEFESRTPRIHALVTGNAAYDNFPDLDLPGVARDVAAIRDLFANELDYDELNAQDDGQVKSYDDFFVRQLPVFLSRVEEGDVFIFYFSGHGFSHRNQNYIVPREFPQNPQMMLSNAVKVTDIAEMAAARRPSAIILIIDSCRTDIALPQSPVEQAFDRAAFTLTVANNPNAEVSAASVVPDPRLQTVIWFPTGPLHAAIARSDAMSPFTEAFVAAASRLRGENERYIDELAEAVQTEYDQLVSPNFPTKTVDHVKSTNSLTAIPNLRLGPQLQERSKEQWAINAYNAREMACLRPIQQFLFNYPWSLKRIAAEKRLAKWIDFFGTTQCRQRSSVVQAPCAVNVALRREDIRQAGRIVVSPKRYPISAPDSTECDEGAQAAIATSGILATGVTVDEARHALADAQVMIAVSEQQSWDGLVVSRTGETYLTDIGVEAFADAQFTQPVDLSGLQRTQAAGRGFNSLGELAPFSIKEFEAVDDGNLKELYQPGTIYRTTETARINIPGLDDAFYVKMRGNSDTDAVDFGRFISEIKIKIDPDEFGEFGYLDELDTMMDGIRKSGKKVFFISLVQTGDGRVDLSDQYNRIMYRLFKNYGVKYSQIVSSKSSDYSQSGSGFELAVFGI